jgi:hypothetical protein
LPRTAPFTTNPPACPLPSPPRPLVSPAAALLPLVRLCALHALVGAGHRIVLTWNTIDSFSPRNSGPTSSSYHGGGVSGPLLSPPPLCAGLLPSAGGFATQAEHLRLCALPDHCLPEYASCGLVSPHTLHSLPPPVAGVCSAVSDSARASNLFAGMLLFWLVTTAGLLRARPLDRDLLTS